LNAKVEEKLREVEWLISAIMAKFNHLGGRRHSALIGTGSENRELTAAFLQLVLFHQVAEGAVGDAEDIGGTNLDAIRLSKGGLQE